MKKVIRRNPKKNWYKTRAVWKHGNGQQDDSAAQGTCCQACQTYRVENHPLLLSSDLYMHMMTFMCLPPPHKYNLKIL